MADSNLLNSIVGSGNYNAAVQNDSNLSNPYSHASVNARNAQYGTGGQNPFVDYAHGQQSFLFGPGYQATQYGAGLEGQREGLYNSLMNTLSQGGINAAARTQRNQIQSNAASGAKQAAMTLKGLGYGDGASAGAASGILGAGAAQANASDQHFNDPSYIASILGQGTGVLNQAMQNPYSAQLEGYEPYIMGQNATNFQQQGQGLFGQVAGLAGAYLGSRAGGVGSGGGGAPIQTNNGFPLSGYGPGSFAWGR